MDWRGVFRNVPWILGLAGALSGLSWAIWLRNRSTSRLIDILGMPGCQVWLQTSLVLIFGGLALTSRASLERVLWLLLMLCCSVQAFRALRSARSASLVEHEGEPGQMCVGQGLSWGPIRGAARWLVRAEPALVLIVAPFLLFPNWLTPWLVLLLALPWLARKLTQGRFTAPTPMDGSILLLMCMLPVSLHVSMNVERSIPKLYGIVLGLAVFYVIVNHVRRPSHAWYVGLGLVALGVVVSVLALLGTEWAGMDALNLPPSFSRMGRRLTDMGGSLSRGFNPNEVGAALTLLLPFATSLLVLEGGSTNGAADDSLPRDPNLRALSRVQDRFRLSMALLGVILMVATLALTGSRATVLGIGVALLLLISLRQGRLWLAMMVTVIAVLAVILCRRPAQTFDSMLVVGELSSIAGRMEIWQRALYMIRDFPYTGVGLNMYSLTANNLYPLFTMPPEVVLRLTHAHNVFLQVAVDVGIPGLVAYLGILVSFGAAWRLSDSRLKHGSLRAVSAGLLCSMVAYHIYGLLDCLTLGAKPGAVLWAMWGLTAALVNMDVPSGSHA